MSDDDTDCSGIRAILAMMVSICETSMTLSSCSLRVIACRAPASSITSMALSGKKRSKMYLSDNLAAACIAARV